MKEKKKKYFPVGSVYKTSVFTNLDDSTKIEYGKSYFVMNMILVFFV